MHSVYVKVALSLSSYERWYKSFKISARKPGAFKISTSFGISPASLICILISASNERLNNSLRAIYNNSWLLQGMKRVSFSASPRSFISVLFSPKMLNFFKKLRTMKRRSGLFLSSIAMSWPIIALFFILRSIYRSSARLSNKWKATNRTFSYFLTITASFFSSFFM